MEYQYCRGCSRSDRRLDRSHIIRRSKRKDLEKVEDNITLHCRTCHDLWDSGNPLKMSKLFDFKLNMEYIYSVDTERWYSLLYDYFNVKENYEKQEKRQELYNSIISQNSIIY